MSDRWAIRHTPSKAVLMQQCKDPGCNAWVDLATFESALSAQIVADRLNKSAALEATDE